MLCLVVSVRPSELLRTCAVTRHRTVTLACPPNTTISRVAFASFGNPVGSCGKLQPGLCHVDVRGEVTKQCHGLQICAWALPELHRDEFCIRSLSTAPVLAVSVECSGLHPISKQLQ